MGGQGNSAGARIAPAVRIEKSAARVRLFTAYALRIAMILIFLFCVFNNLWLPIYKRPYHCCAVGEECTEVYVIPISEFERWLTQETSVMETLPKGEKLYESPADARRAESDRGIRMR